MFETLLAKLARAFREAGLPYMIIGGQAVLLYGEPRLTRDVDVTLGVGPDHLDAVLPVVRGLHLTPLVDPEAFVPQALVLPCEETDSGIRVDLMFSLSTYEREAVERARRVDIGGEAVRFATVEDLLVHKIIAGRPRDVEDARAVLLKNPDVDASYIRRWLGVFEEALERPLRASFDTLYRETR